MMETMVRVFLSCMLVFPVMSCTSAEKPGRRSAVAERPAGENGGQRRAIFPRVMREMPESGVLDLGPVVVTGKAGGMDTMAVLQDVAERIGADAFVLEEKKIGEAYPVKTKTVSGFLETFDGRTYQVATYVVRPTNEGGGVKETGFYRAIRFVEGDPGPCRLDVERLGEELGVLFEGATSLREQIRRLTVLFARGIIDAETFRLVRKTCLDQPR
jgi:hypothetical protein